MLVFNNMFELDNMFVFANMGWPVSSLRSAGARRTLVHEERWCTKNAVACTRSKWDSSHCD